MTKQDQLEMELTNTITQAYEGGRGELNGSGENGGMLERSLYVGDSIVKRTVNFFLNLSVCAFSCATDLF